MKTTQVEQKIAQTLGIVASDAAKIVQKALEGGECTKETIAIWLEERFLPNCVQIDEEGYTKMCINALKILDRSAATDYGSSRQRDLGQHWADMTRGYLGEYAFKLFLAQKAGLYAELGHDAGTLDEYLSMDIHQIRNDDGTYRVPKLKVSIKTSKWNGIWLDIPGNQFNHSDMHVFVKVGAGLDHLFAFFKHISVFKDKVLKRGEEVGLLTSVESAALYNTLPTFQPIPAYVCGFVSQNIAYENLSYTGRRGTKHFTITEWNGPINPTDLEQIQQIEAVTGQIKFKAIGKFSHDKGYLFNTGNLLWRESDWAEQVFNVL